MKSLLSLAAALSLAVVAADANRAEAAPRATLAATWEVQVRYWYFDTEHYHWSTHLRTGNEAAARLTYQRLLRHKQAGRLNRIAPSTNPRYIAVDVRLVRKLRYVADRPLTVRPLAIAHPRFTYPKANLQRTKSKPKAKPFVLPRRNARPRVLPIRRNLNLRRATP